MTGSSSWPCEAGFGQSAGKGHRAEGWILVRVNGSHHIFVMSGRRERIVIPIHCNRPLKTGLLRVLMKIAELEESDV